MERTRFDVEIVREGNKFTVTLSNDKNDETLVIKARSQAEAERQLKTILDTINYVTNVIPGLFGKEIK